MHVHVYVSCILDQNFGPYPTLATRLGHSRSAMPCSATCVSAAAAALGSATPRSSATQTKPKTALTRTSTASSLMNPAVRVLAIARGSSSIAQLIARARIPPQLRGDTKMPARSICVAHARTHTRTHTHTPQGASSTRASATRIVSAGRLFLD